MKPAISVVDKKILIGKSKHMTLQEDATRELWQSFMPYRQAIPGRVDEKLYNMKVFDSSLDVRQLTPATPFRKFAAVEVESADSCCDGMEAYALNGGLYAMFLHHGPAHTFHQTLQYIYEEWMPASGYQLDNREHFERFDPTYHPADPNAVEEVWIPIKRGTDLAF
ncbi:GyrI-like domain-containing protein [Bacillus sp. KH172YL63]|uniref:GyrI-like domain-containing protein n=1 Tax=Bacillus sp. KH172YL63 TaxID=2709784 RepID=UPI0013E44211|nr:GyrI-like domain-containing protein [Bacillus sp. KH172YL63]BCB02601.1 hypothetical protein KH172YL63_07340 [Bacillus sp. KH172YL63]